MKKNEMEYLANKELESIQAAMAMMAFNPSIGRTLAKGDVNRFILSSVKKLPFLEKSRTKEDFNSFHDKWCRELMNKLGKTRDGCGYGSAQKGINVLLKLYVYWSKIPKNSKTLINFLHVPLDSVIIEYLETHHEAGCEKGVWPLYEDGNQDIYSLKSMTKKQYLAWQKLIREIAGRYPPILIDVVWANERLKNAIKPVN